MVVLTLLATVLTSSFTVASQPTLGEGSGAAGTHSVPREMALSDVSSSGDAAAPVPMRAETSSASEIRINEVMFCPDPAGHEWIELKNSGSASVSISGYGITDEDGNWYRVPAALPDVPGGDLVVVVFDGMGSGSDDYDFSDSVATLHSPPGLVDIFEDDADQCGLYSASSFLYLPLVLRNYAGPISPVPAPSTGFSAPPIVAFVAWGAPPGADAGRAAAVGIWEAEWYVSLARGLGVESSDTLLGAGESIGLGPASQTSYPDDWVLFQVGEVTQGQENSSPAISWYYPAGGATVDGATFTISWNAVAGATGYRFQMADNSDFDPLTVDETLTEPTYAPTSPVAEGDYYWRVKVIYAASESSWSPGVQIESLALPSMPSSYAHLAQLPYKVLGITWQLQHKDTWMLDLDGSPETGQARWDSAHEDDGDHTCGNGTPVRVNALDNWYCVRASTSMMASYYGGELSQDRVSYQIFGGGGPEGDLGHGTGPTYAQIASTVSWALGTTVTRQTGKPTFDQIKTWIDADQPIGSTVPGHMRVIDGYAEVPLGIVTWQFIHLLDPWSRAQWVGYSGDNIDNVWVGPATTAGAPGVRSDEDIDGDGTADTIDDSDGDGICDFDERNRFRGNLRNLDANDSDSDDDLVPDKLDMREYLFDDAGNYSRRPSDIDGDGDRKETDPDNDNFWDVGSIDGCEDTNQNGKFESGPGETSNFDPLSEKECPAPVVDITSPASGSSDDDCVIGLQGTVTSDTNLTSLSALVTSGTQSNRFDLAWSGSAPDYQFSQNIPLFSGDNVVLVNAVNEFGSASDFITVICTTAVEDIHVQLSWPLLDSDVDLHLIRPGAVSWGSGDCYFNNMNPDWGVQGDPSDDPELDIDCITGCTLENIVLSKPENGTYSVKLHYYWDWDLGPTSPSVRIWVQGTRYDFGPQYMTDNQVWDVATIEWPSKVVAGGGGVASQSPQGRRLYPKE